MRPFWWKVYSVRSYSYNGANGYISSVWDSTYFTLIVLLVTGWQTVPIFPNKDLTSFFLSTIYGTGLWLLRRPFLYVFYISLPVLIALPFGVMFGPLIDGEDNLERLLDLQVGLLYFVYVDMLFPIHHTGCWRKHVLQATIKPCSWILSAWCGLCCIVRPCPSVCKVYLEYGLALVS